MKLIKKLRSKNWPIKRRRPKWLEKPKIKLRLNKKLLRKQLLLLRSKLRLQRPKPPLKWPELKNKLRNSRLNSLEKKPPKRLDKNKL